MTETTEAIYQNGTFRLINPLSASLNEGQKVRIVVEADEETAGTINPIMKLAENFYEGLSGAEIDEIEEIMLDRSNFLGDRTP